MKTCVVCSREYSPMRRGMCNACYTRAARAADPEAFRAKERAYRGARREHVNAVHREWCRRNADRRRAQLRSYKRDHRAFYARHAEKIRAWSRAWRAANAEKHCAQSRAWRQANPEQQRLQGLAKAARRRAADGRGLTRQQWEFILDCHDRACAYCNRTDVKLTADHVMPLRHGGHHDPLNIVPACRSCNSRKRDSLGVPMLDHHALIFAERGGVVRLEEILLAERALTSCLRRCL